MATTASAQMMEDYRPHPVSFLRAYSPSATDHFYTTNVVEMDNAVNHLGYTREKPVGLIFPKEISGTCPLYRTYSQSATDHFYTASASERDNAVRNLGYIDEGVVGRSATDHFYTSDAAERDNAVRNLGYVDEGVVGYILPC